jgi:hypothetical protein
MLLAHAGAFISIRWKVKVKDWDDTRPALNWSCVLDFTQ